MDFIQLTIFTIVCFTSAGCVKGVSGVTNNANVNSDGVTNGIPGNFDVMNDIQTVGDSFPIVPPFIPIPEVPCPLIDCPVLNVSPDCLEFSAVMLNGRWCPVCPSVKSSCQNRAYPNPTTTDPLSLLACPDLHCPETYIPPGCEYVETYQFMGKTCNKCPVRRSVCVGDSRPRPVCPHQTCPETYIPPECRDIPTFDYMGLKCSGCPRIKPRCNTVLGNNTEVRCPVMACIKIFIPEECREVPTFEIQGKFCDGCPRRKKDCSSGPPLDFVSDADIFKTDIACPLQMCEPVEIPVHCREIPTFEFMGKICNGCPRIKEQCQQTEPVECPAQTCPSTYIPEECREFSTFLFQGKICSGCPRFREGCLPSPLQPPFSCPVKVCPFITQIPPECRERVTYGYRGLVCDDCPKMKISCISKATHDINIAEESHNVEVQCPLQICQPDSIPDECLEIPTFEHMGTMCPGCPRHRESCTPSHDNTRSTTTSLPVSSCPPQACPLSFIPEECRVIPTFEFNGRTCQGCPEEKPGCIALFSASSNDVSIDIPCPLQECQVLYIPPECRESTYLEHNGKICEGCPRKRENCTVDISRAPVAKRPEISCPLLECKVAVIPPECNEESTYEFQGKTCRGCPKFKDECVPSTGNTDAHNAEVACPIQTCADIDIPLHCREDTSFELNGKMCPGCPRMIPECILKQPEIKVPPVHEAQIECPVQVCPLSNIPPECTEINTFIFNGKMCDGCPKYKEGCIPKQPEILVDISTQMPPIQCPIQACPLIYIPPECRETVRFEFNGKMCDGCPRMKEKCFQNVPETTTQATTPEQQDACPVQACPTVDIPSECIEVIKFDYKGTMCEGCPRRKENCTSNKPETSTQEPLVECPVQICSMDYIPPECKEAISFDFNGRTCEGCPKMKENCPLDNPESTTQATTEKSPFECPVQVCPVIYIPPACRETTEFDFNGNTCEGCPRMKEGCMPNKTETETAIYVTTQEPPIECPLQACPMVFIPVECREITTFVYHGKVCNGCPKFKEFCKPSDHTSSTTGENSNNGPQVVHGVACPIQNCAALNVPRGCQVNQTFEFMGRLCQGCPTMKASCRSETMLDPSKQNNASLATCPVQRCPKILIPPECLEIPKFHFQGRMCDGCPQWKDSCRNLPPVSQTLQENDTAVKPGELECPVKMCPEYIPRECQVKVTYEIAGLICEDCPTRSDAQDCRLRRPFSVDTSTPSVIASDVVCPIVTCQNNSVPLECREEVMYIHQGKTCNGCPKAREGCIANSCPTIECPKINFPKECIVTQPYSHYGKICFRCPKLNENCSTVSQESNNAQVSDTVKTLVNNPFLTAVRDARQRCPELHCPLDNIPFHCQVHTTYRYRDQICPGCPIWRNGCGLLEGNGNLDGLLAFSLFSQMFNR